MRILCTNDDGIHARGLESLVKIARALSDEFHLRELMRRNCRCG